jgi:hypothetical protein
VSHQRGAQRQFSRELVLVQLGPREYEPQVAARKVAVDHLERVDPHLGVALSVASVEVRRSVVVEEHRDRDAEEPTDRRLKNMLPPPPAASLTSLYSSRGRRPAGLSFPLGARD